MSELMRLIQDAVADVESTSSRRTRREMEKEVTRTAARGVVRAAEARSDAYVAETRLRAAADVTRTGLAHLADLSAEEERLVRLAPLGEVRYRAIIDQYAALAAGEIARLGSHR
ncbi:hypothetical protein ABZ769_11400 [Streptomyces olivoreticuli]